MSIQVRAGRVLAAAVAASVLVQAVAMQRGIFWLKVATRPMVMSLLAGLVMAEAARVGREVPRPLVTGLALAAAGDTLLAFDTTGALLAGMALFGGTHLCYLTGFRGLRRPGHRTSAALVAAYGAAWLALLKVLWRRLDVVRLPAALYGLVLFTMTATAASVGPGMYVGAMSFLLSDLAIGLRVAGIRFPGQQPAIGGLYLLGQFLITRSWLGSWNRPQPSWADRITGWVSQQTSRLPVPRSWVGGSWMPAVGR